MNEPLEAKKAPDANGGEGLELAPQASALVAYRSSEYPGWQPWELRWREIVNSGGTILCAPAKIRGTPLEKWAREYERVLPLAGITTLRDRKWPLDWGICNIYEELPRPNVLLRRLARSAKAKLVLCTCPKHFAYGQRVVNTLRVDHQYTPHIWQLMETENQTHLAEEQHRERLLRMFYAIDPDDMDAWITSIETGGQR